ncbi:hypothetical protein CVT26_011737 [Gymnopilus dilepis]|uniref:Peptidase C14 caspase domain-containing protein n=1 Tax=Gymnopilus dilepis TaxID=231916 RepID=A0A409W5T7_9AGAR|nr:hypothetical protein CVT26_011737 [Gymnopilus dilepis]
MKIIKYKFRVPGRKQPSAPPKVVEKRIKKKALLIGVQQVPEASLESETDAGIEDLESGPRAKLKKAKKKLLKRKSKKTALRGPHRDVRAMQVYNYDPADIVTLIDDGDPNHKQPTALNIVAEMRKLVEGAAENDRFFFHCHSAQEETEDIEEEDRKNEFILTSDGGRIQDNTLREILVDSLPTKTSLIAVFDSCFSGTLLDLKHFRCNRIYVPWINKGERRTASLWNANTNVVQKEISTRNQPPPLRVRRRRWEAFWERTSIDHVLSTPNNSTDAHDRKTAKVPPELPILSNTKSLSIITDIPTALNSSLSKTMFFDAEEANRHCLSPEPLYCTGFCREELMGEELGPVADVISISSSKDSQRSWEGKNGFSMTSVLVRTLSMPRFHAIRHPADECALRAGKDAHPTLEDLMTDVSHQIHKFYLGFHDKARKYKKEVRSKNVMRVRSGKAPREGDEVEMNNFQNPQDMSRRFYP